MITKYLLCARRGRQLTAFVAILVATQSWAQPATSNTPLFQIPFDTISRMAIVEVRIDDSRVLRCVLDTGMPEGLFLFDPALGTELGLKYVGSAAVRGSGPARRTASIAMGLTLRLGELELANERVIVLDEPSQLVGMGADGAIGGSLFKRYVVEMDFQSSIVSLYAPESFDPAGSGGAVELTMSGPRPYVNATVSVDGTTTLPVRLVVDTGATNSLSLNTRADGTLDLPKKTVGTVLGAGVGGDILGVVGRVSSLRLGTLEFNDLVGRFPDQSKGEGDGTLGMGVLRRFTVTIDYSNRRLLLRPNSSFGEPFEYNMAGLLLMPMHGGRLRVHDVIDASPAAQAGIRPNDVIVAVSGQRLEKIGDTSARRLFKQHGKTIVLTLDRDGKQIEVTLRLERLI